MENKYFEALEIEKKSMVIDCNWIFPAIGRMFRKYGGLPERKGGFLLLKKAWNPPFAYQPDVFTETGPGIQPHNGCSGLPESGS